MTPKKHIERVALPDQVYEILREQIFDRIFAPDEKLNIEALARDLRERAKAPPPTKARKLIVVNSIRAAMWVGVTGATASAPCPGSKRPAVPAKSKRPRSSTPIKAVAEAK